MKKTKNNTGRQQTPYAAEKGATLKVLVLPKSSQSKIVGIHNSVLKLKLTKPPLDGQANAECCKIIAKYLGVPKSHVTIVQGQTARQKVLLVKSISAEEVDRRFAKLASP